MNNTAVISGHSILTCLGTSSTATWQALLSGKVGLKKEEVLGGYHCPVGRIPGWESVQKSEFDSLIRASLFNPPNGWDWSSPLTGWIIGSAKGNISTLAKEEGAYCLAKNAQFIARDLGLQHSPICISTACTSSLAAIVLAVRMMKSGQYRQIAITGCDLASDFVLNGFNRLKAVSSEVCRPYDAD